MFAKHTNHDIKSCKNLEVFMLRISLANIACVAMLVLVFHNSADAIDKELALQTRLSDKERAIISNLISDVSVAAASGDEKLVTKLLLSNVQRNPKIADKILWAFIENQEGAKSKAMMNIDTTAIINNILSNLEKQGHEDLVALLLRSVMPAAGSGVLNNKNQDHPAILPPKLPANVTRGGDTVNDEKTSHIGVH